MRVLNKDQETLLKICWLANFDLMPINNFDLLLILIIIIIIIGASAVRRDAGRGLTAAQWARYCSRNLCADSIERFMRNAVDGGILSEQAMGSGNGSFDGSNGSGSSSGGSHSKGARKKDFLFLSKNGNGPAWLAKKFRKAFSRNSSSSNELVMMIYPSIFLRT